MKKITYLLAIIVVSLYIISIGTTVDSKTVHMGNESILANVPNSYDSNLLAHSQKLSAPNPDTTVWITITLNYQHQNELNKFLKDVSDPTSPNFRHFMTQNEFNSKFSPDTTVYNNLVNYLVGKGLKIEYTWNNHLTITVMDKMSKIENAFNVNFYNYHTQLAGKRSYFWSASGPLSLPNEFIPYLKGIDGADNSKVFHTNLQIQKKLQPNFWIDNSTGVQNVFASDLQKAYDTVQLYNNSATAASSSAHVFATGKTIVTLLWEGTDSNGSQVAPFDPENILYYYNNTMPQWEKDAGGIPTVSGIGTNGTVPPGPSAANDQPGDMWENILDLEVSGMQAPGSNLINVYGPGDMNGSNLESNFPDNEFGIVVNMTNNLTAVSNSWGGGDTFSSFATESEVAQLNAEGVTVLASAGDDGDTTIMSNPANDALDDSGFIAVGGTTMALNGYPSNDSSGTNITDPINWQTVWYDNSPSPYGHYGTTSGTTTAYPIPSWQNISSVIGDGGSTSGRNIADVAAVANNTIVYADNSGAGYNADYYMIGGTSVSSPVVAGQVTEIAAYLGTGINGASGGLGFFAPLLYQIGPNNTKYANPPFYDVTTNPAGYHNPAQSGWDYPTGWGSINSWNFVQALKFIMNVNPTTITVAAGSSETISIGVNYPTLFNSSVSLNVTGLPTGVTADFSSAIVDPSPNNLTSGSSILTLYTTTSTLPGTYLFTINGINYDKSTGNYGNLVSSIQMTLVVKYSYPVTFTESGLPSGTPWTITIAGKQDTSTTDTISVLEYNGSFPYSVNAIGGYSASPSSGMIPVNGAGVNQIITFTQVKYSLKFTESGLSSGTSWSVTLEGIQNASITDTITFTEPNGTYPYTIGPISGYAISPASGSMIVKGTGLMQTITFTQIKYTLRFTESGLPTGTSWLVTLAGTPYSVTSNNITISEPNGTYTYSIGAISGYTSSPASGSIKVNGSDVNQVIKFSQATYTVTFTESGLPSGTSWSVNLGGTLHTSTSSVITFTVPNGAYTYLISNISGYSSTPTSGTVSVSGNNVSSIITFQTNSANNNSNTIGGLSNAVWYGLVVIIIIVVIIAIVAIMLRRKKEPIQDSPKENDQKPAQEEDDK